MAYGPHKVVAEVSNHNEPIGKGVWSSMFESQLMSDSSELRVKWFGCHLIRDSNDLVVILFEIQMISKMKLWNSITRLPSKMKLWSSKTKHFCEIPSKMKLWSSKTKHFCETSFKNEALKLKNEAFLRDFLQKWSFEHQKRSISARPPSKMTCWPHSWPQNSNTF